MWHRMLLLRQRGGAAAAGRFSSSLSSRLLQKSRSRAAGAAVANSSSFSTLPQEQANANKKKPFDRVLVANRGEIAERVIRTCQSLGIETIAIHSTVDAQARFVRKADRAVCIGPAAAAASYLNTQAVLDAIELTDAQAVHPGYGFLSENADFADQIQSIGAVWLGPPTSAVQEMGDKIMSKKLAERAGVTTIPGYDQEVESVEQALKICNDVIGYPVLLKAAAGGGGKGMRVCYTDQDIRDSWSIAKAESKKFFSDDRLLLEKYIEEPHHIEFQVLCSKNKDGTTDVAVFPERECSIQRRNQKVIEESPSVLLKEETRRAMAEQVVRLCQEVGYESAGTVEFLVDKDQGFYFLEMNTRLQVEHPITEAISGLDLVKGQLWVGAGWGFPPEFNEKRQGNLIMPYQGHAIEARLYAEDPLRAFLPSTGPLAKYIEPNMAGNRNDHYLRIDSGVTAGHQVTPHYDPMLAKVIYYAPNRTEAIAGLSNALDEYVIDGVQHNARLIQSVLREPAFQRGDTPTSFLPTHYPDGFSGVNLTETEEDEFAVAAAVIAANRSDFLQQPPLVGTSHDGDDDDSSSSNCVIVKLGGLFGKAYRVELGENAATVQTLVDPKEQTVRDSEERTIRLDSRAPIQYDPEHFVAHIMLNGKTRTIQVLEKVTTGELEMQMFGADMTVLIQSPREYELSLHMREPEKPDTTDLVLSPMPGTLISYAVKEGDEVQVGQELCIVEAMKMQNIIRSVRHGTIASCKVKTGASLMADQVILEFEPNKQ